MIKVSRTNPGWRDSIYAVYGWMNSGRTDPIYISPVLRVKQSYSQVHVIIELFKVKEFDNVSFGMAQVVNIIFWYAHWMHFISYLSHSLLSKHNVSQDSALKTVLWHIMVYFYKLCLEWRVVSLALIPNLLIFINYKIYYSISEPRYEPVYLDRPPIEQWMAEEREKAWLEYQEAKKEFPELTKPNSRPIEFMVPYVGKIFVWYDQMIRKKKIKFFII